jgi:hypothetical protein
VNIFCSCRHSLIINEAVDVLVGREHAYIFYMKFCCKSTVTNMATTRNLEIVSDNLNANGIFIWVITCNGNDTLHVMSAYGGAEVKLHSFILNRGTKWK